jgi:hypothetical protein
MNKLASFLPHEWHYRWQSNNTAIFSKFQVVKTAHNGDADGIIDYVNTWGYKIKLAQGEYAWIFNAHFWWKPYGPYQVNGFDGGGPSYDLTKNPSVQPVIQDQAEGSWRSREVTAMIDSITSSGALEDDTPIFITGDFNEPSHQDWTSDAVKAGLKVAEIPWPTSLKFTDIGLTDSYRSFYPDEVKYPGKTWASDDRKVPQDRIDFVYFGGSKVTVTNSQTMGPPGYEGTTTEDIEITDFGSDHKGVVSTFTINIVR